MNLKLTAIASQWHDLLEACGEHGPRLLMSVEEYLTDAKVPGVSWAYQSYTTGLLGEFIQARRREHLVIRAAGIHSVVAVNARKFGTLLAVSWYLVPAPTLLKAIRQRLSVSEDEPRVSHEIADLPAFERADLAAFVTLTRLALRFSIRLLVGKEGKSLLADPPLPDGLQE